MTTNPDTRPMTSRELTALGIATTAVTLAVGVTVAVLAGHMQLADPWAPAGSELFIAAESVEPASVSSPRVVLVPVERAPASRDTASPDTASSTPEPLPRNERGHDDREEADEDRHEGHERAEHHERREGRRHESLWGDDEEEGFDG